MGSFVLLDIVRHISRKVKSGHCNNSHTFNVAIVIVVLTGTLGAKLIDSLGDYISQFV